MSRLKDRIQAQDESVSPPQLATNVYLAARLAAIGVTDVSAHLLEEENRYRQVQLIEAKGQDEIVFRYADLDGGMKKYRKGRFEIEYTVRRPEQHQGRQKYIAPAGAEQQLWIPPLVIQDYQAAREFPDLYITNGQFKALAMNHMGLHAVSIGGMYHFNLRSQPIKKDLISLLTICRPRRIILLLDANTRRVEYKEDSELTEHLHKVYMACKAFADILLPYATSLHVLELPGGPGIDDLPPEERSLSRLPEPERVPMKPQDLKTWLSISSPEAFFAKYALQADFQEKEWRYYGAIYRMADDGRIEEIRHKDAARFIRVSCTYFKAIKRPTAAGDSVRELIPWQAGEISRDYGKDFFKWIERYDSFCNVPNHQPGQYQRVIETEDSRSYNLYYPLEAEPTPGEWPTIEKFVKHIFGEVPTEVVTEDGNTITVPRWQLGLDYIQIIYQYPLQRMPVLSLVNKLRNTGKSTFLEFMRLVFGENVTICGNDDLQDRFNSSFATKLVVAIDEGFIEKKMILEKLKSMATARTVKIEAKGKDKLQVDFIGKFILTSNDETNFVMLDDEEIRFWVIKVPQFKEENPDLIEDMKAEIPAFLQALSERKIVAPRRSRMWFAPEVLRTPELERVFTDSRSLLEKEMRIVIEEMFIQYAEPVLHLTLAALFDAMQQSSKYRIQMSDIQRLLNEVWVQKGLCEKDKVASRQDIPKLDTFNGVTTKTYDRQKTGRYYHFKIETFMNAEEIESLGITSLPF